MAKTLNPRAAWRALIFGIAFVHTIVEAVPVTLVFEGTVDATRFGLSSATSFEFMYAYDTGLEIGSGPVPTTSASGSYGPISATVRLGTDAFALTSDTGIAIFNNAGVPQTDNYIVRGLGSSARIGTATYTDVLARVVLTDLDAEVFSSTTLPTTLDFLSGIDQLTIQLTGISSSNRLVLAAHSTQSFTLRQVVTPVPEPSTAALVLLGLATINVLYRRRPLVSSR
jgi:hypothetical protein